RPASCASLHCCRPNGTATNSTTATAARRTASACGNAPPARQAACGWTACRRPTAAFRCTMTAWSIASKSSIRARGDPLLRRHSAIQRAQHAVSAPIEYVRVDLGGCNILVAQQLLHGADVISRLQQMRGERMAQRMRAHRLDDARTATGAFHGARQQRLVKVVPTLHAVQRIDRALRRRKHELPTELAPGA